MARKCQSLVISVAQKCQGQVFQLVQKMGPFLWRLNAIQMPRKSRNTPYLCSCEPFLTCTGGRTIFVPGVGFSVLQGFRGPKNVPNLLRAWWIWRYSKGYRRVSIAAFFKVLVASTIQLCRSFLGLLLPIRVQHHRPYWLPVTRLT